MKLRTIAVLAGMLLSFGVMSRAEAREWTILVFLNGHNNLDSFGTDDINEMEAVGSSQERAIVVQWASMKSDTTKRLLVRKDRNPTNVSSPVIEEMPRVDMGDYQALIEFIQWGMEKYPAKHYFVDVWNHGSGWHLREEEELFRSISHDDISGNHITTEQLGLAMRTVFETTGNRIDIYGSDACLMGMHEVSEEMREAVDYFVGSEELEPGPGWPYDTWLAELAKNPEATPRELGTYLVEEYVKSYQDGSQGYADVTLAMYDLAYADQINEKLRSLAAGVDFVGEMAKQDILTAAQNAQRFYYRDYMDLGDFLTRLRESMDLTEFAEFEELGSVLENYVVINRTTDGYSAAQGVAIWFPLEQSTVKTYGEEYQRLAFNKRLPEWYQMLTNIVP